MRMIRRYDRNVKSTIPSKTSQVMAELVAMITISYTMIKGSRHTTQKKWHIYRWDQSQCEERGIQTITPNEMTDAKKGVLRLAKRVVEYIHRGHGSLHVYETVRC